MADLEQVVNDLNLASQSLQELREKYDGALDLLDNKNTEITGALDSAKSDALQEIQTISNTATSQISQLKDTSLNLVNEAKNTATTEISNKKEEHKQELETKKNEYINEIDAKANEYDIANINAQVQAMDTKITEQINGAKTELNSKIDNKVTKTGDETIAGVKTFSSSIVIPNATANNHATNLGQLNSKVAKTGDETIAGVKTFSVPPVSTTNPTANNQVANKSYVDTVGNSKVSLNGNQTIAGVKTFNAAPVCGANPTQDAQLARKWYVDYGGGIKNLGTTGSINLDLRQAQHFILTANAGTSIGIANFGGVGKSGTITINNCQNVVAFNAPFKFRIAQSGFSGTETFAYFCIASNNVRLVRT
ncbi:coiled-coil domain-containing protein [Campylobacter jejuni]|uniref:hypothetical protein n=1 Tax=Campylobacter jejuni TaxID=197 RepID=UPI00138788E0|nr:hypothetical protein [Campylobacter jejuni]ECL0212173.1 hypothetical protein [Campylobacter jejuni]EDP5180095.1 hypothetical protein [Campylobacter jejuni]EKD8536357.1 hypothetical protein [Campylobacter jejuni]BEK23986.1 hypothetical protein B11320_05340 [Campylobacter jejuni]HDV6438170.1 hypothetical protein [Campylobacter jejuni]